MKPIDRIDRIQADHTTISVAVEVWNKLEHDLRDQPKSVKQQFMKRRDRALGPPHYLANMCDHRLRGQNIPDDRKELAYEYLNVVDSRYIPIVMAFTTCNLPFPAYLFAKTVRSTPPLTWWKSLNFPAEWMKLKTR